LIVLDFDRRLGSEGSSIGLGLLGNTGCRPGLLISFLQFPAPSTFNGSQVNAFRHRINGYLGRKGEAEMHIDPVLTSTGAFDMTV